MQNIAYLWLALIVIFAVAEASTVQLMFIWFACGAVVAFLVSLLSAPLWLQILLFLAVSAVTLIFTRPLVKKLLLPKTSPTNADRVIGETATVVTAIDNDAYTGRVSVLGLDWMALSENDEPIAVGEKVTVKRIEGAKLIVCKE